MTVGHRGTSDGAPISLFDDVEDANAILCVLLVVPLIAVGGTVLGGTAVLAAQVLGLTI